jgi:hypothetical protein
MALLAPVAVPSPPKLSTLFASQVVAEHPRHTRKRLLLEPTHYEGESTDRIEAPIPLGRMGRKLQELWALAPERRAIAQYAALAEVAR